MHHHKIVFIQGIDRKTTFGCVVGVEVTGRSRHVDDSQSDDLGQPANQIDGGDAGAAHAELILKPLDRQESNRGRRP